MSGNIIPYYGRNLHSSRSIVDPVTPDLTSLWSNPRLECASRQPRYYRDPDSNGYTRMRTALRSMCVCCGTRRNPLLATSARTVLRSACIDLCEFTQLFRYDDRYDTAINDCHGQLIYGPISVQSPLRSIGYP